jgi:cytochrome c oxidase subunit 2
VTPTRDLLPNRYTVVWFTATQVGTFDILCAEYCGRQHSSMHQVVRVVSETEYQEWLTTQGGQANLDPVAFGGSLFNSRGCVACHATTADGGPALGPRLFGVYGREERMEGGSTVHVDDNYLRESIMNPSAQIVAGFTTTTMPVFAGQLNETQINALIDYLKSLGQGE